MKLPVTQRTGRQLNFSGRQSLITTHMSQEEMEMKSILVRKISSVKGLGKVPPKLATYIICLNFPNIFLNGEGRPGSQIFMNGLSLIISSHLRILKREMLLTIFRSTWVDLKIFRIRSLLHAVSVQEWKTTLNMVKTFSIIMRMNYFYFNLSHPGSPGRKKELSLHRKHLFRKNSVPGLSLNAKSLLSLLCRFAIHHGPGRVLKLK